MLESFKTGRPATAIFVIGMGISSAVFNIFGALNTYTGFAVFIFAAGVLFAEAIALTAMTHINTDWDNNNYLKAILGSVLFVGVVCFCFMSGKQAFNIVQSDAVVAYQAKLSEIDRLQAVADDKFARAASADTENEKNRLYNSAEIQQKRVDTAQREATKMKPVPGWFTYLFLVVMELVKATGRYALAVPSDKKWTLRQRKIQNIKDKAKLAEVKDNVVQMKKKVS